MAAAQIPRFAPFACPLEGANMVEASAGTGKTYGLSWIAARFLLERAIPIDGLLAVTFTNAATAELRSALRERLKTALALLEGRACAANEAERDYAASLSDRDRAAGLARTALAELDRVAVSSIHGFCQRVLGERAFESGVPFDAVLLEGDRAFARQIADDFWSLETYEASIVRARELAEAHWSPGRVRGIVELIARDPETALVWSTDPVSRDVETRLRAFTARAFAARRQASRGLSFNDLLFELDRALADGDRGAALVARLRERYGAVLIDEFQDTNAVQYRIFRRIFREGGKPFFAFGDPKQAIYRFRGGDVFTYLEATADSSARRWALDVNYRSDDGVVRGVNALFGACADPFRSGGRIEFLPAIPRPEAVGRAALFEDGRPVAPFRVLRHDGPAKELPRLVAADVASLLASETFVEVGDARAEERGGRRLARVTARDIAILTRSNAQLRPLAEALEGRGIATSTAGDASVFDTDEASHLARLLEGIARKDDAAMVATAIAIPLFGLEAQEIRAVAQGERAHAVWARRMDALAQVFEATGPIGLIAAAFELGGRDVEARTASRLRHLAELAQLAQGGERDAGETAAWLRARMADRDEAAEDAQLRPGNDGDAVRLMTVHKAKGLEFPVVYVPHFSKLSGGGSGWQPAEYHDPAGGFAACADLGWEAAPARAALAGAEAVGEEMRLFYVAATRARHLVKIVWAPPGRNAKAGPADALLRELVAAGGGVKIEPFGACEVRGEDRGVAVEERTPVVQTALSSIPRIAITSSFTALVAGAKERVEAPEAAGESPELPLSCVPAGRRTGLLFHEIMEGMDFPSADRVGIASLAAAALPRYGLSTDLGEIIADGIAGALDAPFASGLPGLRAISRRARADELRFLFPAQRPGAEPGVTPAAISEALRAGGGDAFVERCAERARELAFERFTGHVAGAIDLVFERGGKWYLADYKSNHLGARLEDYGAAGLERAMLQHHYYLQAHLYALALHRYLRVRAPGYDYGARFGGVFYLFLRGMRPDSTRGVFLAKPSWAAIDALDRLFAAEGRPGR
jgi:exodeoxyribonuclease V beta subunit